MKLKKNSWHYRIYNRWNTWADRSTVDICSYIWGIIAWLTSRFFELLFIGVLFSFVLYCSFYFYYIWYIEGFRKIMISPLSGLGALFNIAAFIILIIYLKYKYRKILCPEIEFIEDKKEENEND